MKIQEMLATHPKRTSINEQSLVNCITACIECADTCTICADACLGEDKVQMLVNCIRMNLDCADICRATASVLSRQTGFDPQIMRMQLEACAAVCQKCTQECEQHAEMHRHCRVCATSCRTCEEACRILLSSLQAH